MSCLHPLVCCGSFRNDKTGKYLFTKIYKKEDLDPLLMHDVRKYEHWFPVPCGRCVGCKVDKARDWSVRIYHESLSYKSNYFLTLTYDDEHIPSDLSIHKSDLMEFINKIRNFYGHQGHYGIKFFGSGEYGSVSGRCHYHLILFNCPITDLEFYKAVNGNVYQKSKFIDDVWSKGYVVIGDVTPESANYVARYTLKKLGCDDYSERGLESPFLVMSNHPGLGYNYWLKHKSQLFEDWRCLMPNGQYASLPKYYKKLFKEDPEYMYKILPKLEKLEDQVFDNMFLDYCLSDRTYREILDSKGAFLKAQINNKRGDSL